MARQLGWTTTTHQKFTDYRTYRIITPISIIDYPQKRETEQWVFEQEVTSDFTFTASIHPVPAPNAKCVSQDLDISRGCPYGVYRETWQIVGDWEYIHDGSDSKK